MRASICHRSLFDSPWQRYHISFSLIFTRNFQLIIIIIHLGHIFKWIYIVTLVFELTRIYFVRVNTEIYMYLYILMSILLVSNFWFLLNSQFALVTSYVLLLLSNCQYILFIYGIVKIDFLWNCQYIFFFGIVNCLCSIAIAGVIYIYFICTKWYFDIYNFETIK